MSTVSVAASDSASGYGYTLYGTINDTRISGYATGSYASDVNVKITSPQYYTTAGTVVYCGAISSMSYVTYYSSSFDNGFYRWKCGTVKASLSSSTGTTTLRTLIN